MNKLLISLFLSSLFAPHSIAGPQEEKFLKKEIDGPAFLALIFDDELYGKEYADKLKFIKNLNFKGKAENHPYEQLKNDVAKFQSASKRPENLQSGDDVTPLVKALIDSLKARTDELIKQGKAEKADNTEILKRVEKADKTDTTELLKRVEKVDKTANTELLKKVEKAAK